MALTTKRIIALPSQTDPQEGDYLAIDNATGGTKKIPVGKVGAKIDDTLTEAGKAADAKATGDAIDEIRSQLEVTGTASGAIATFSDGSDAPMKSCIVSIEPQQSGTGTPSPDNVRTISGWESVNLYDTGVNVWDEEWELGGINTSGQETPTSGYYRSKNYIAVLPNTTYYFKVPTTMSVMFYDSNKDFIEWTTANNATVATPSNCRYLRFRNTTANSWTPYNNDISINYPSTDTSYHAYNATTTTVNLGRTVYGGTLDVVSGVLTVTKVGVDLGSLTWAAYGATSSYDRYVTNDIDSTVKEGTVGICSHLQGSRTFSPGNIVIGTGAGKLSAFTEKEQYASASAFKTAMNGATLVYELATPQTYTLTATEVSTLLGENNVWADSGDVSVVYVRDLNIAINNLIGE